MSLGTGIAALVVIGGGVLLLLVLAGARRAIDFVPMTAERRELAARAGPAVGAVLVLLYAAVGLGALLGDRPGPGSFAVAGLVLLVIAVAWPALRDVASGVVLKTGRACRVGDYVRVDGIKGRVQKLGLRALTLETSEGHEALVPYSRVVRDTLYREPAREHVAHHVFRVEAVSSEALRELKERVRVAALHVHWHSVVRDPQMTVLDGRALEVTVFPIHPDRGPDIEGAVRAALAPPEPKPATPPRTTVPPEASQPS